MSASIVLCDAHYLPVEEICIEHAVHLLVTGKAEAVIGSEGATVAARLGLAPSAIANWSESLGDLIEDGKFLVPAVIRLRRAIAHRLASLKPSRNLVFRRDRHTCQYCGGKAHLTIDHVMPQSRGGGDTWENLVTACAPCNHSKGARTPEEAGLLLATRPRRFTPNATMDLMARLQAALA